MDILSTCALFYMQAVRVPAPSPHLAEQIDRVTRLAASEPVEYGIDTRLKLADALAPRYPARAKRQILDAQAALAGVQEKKIRNMWSVQIVRAMAPLDFEEAERLTKSIEPDRENDDLAEAYDVLCARREGARDELIGLALSAGAFRSQCAAKRLHELQAAAPDRAMALFERISNAFPDSPNKQDIDYLQSRIKDMGRVEGDALKSALEKVRAASESLGKLPPARENASQPNFGGSDLSGFPYSEALEKANALKEDSDRVSALIDLSRRMDLTPQQRGRVASEALAGAGKMKLSNDRLLALSMLSRDFVLRHEYSSASLAAQMLLDTYNHACGCGASVCNQDGAAYECIELINAFADYLHELNVTQESLGLHNVSLEARLLIFEMAKSR